MESQDFVAGRSKLEGSKVYSSLRHVAYCLSLTSGTLLRLAATSHLINDMMGTSDERCNLDVLEPCGSRSGQRSLEWRGGFPNCRPVTIRDPCIRTTLSSFFLRTIQHFKYFLYSSDYAMSDITTSKIARLRCPSAGFSTL